MAPQNPKIALVPDFDWTTGTADLRLVFASGTYPVDVPLGSGTYSMFLAPSSGTVQDVLRAFKAVTDTALSSAGRASTSTFSLLPSGRVRVALTEAFTLATGRPGNYLLGLAGGGSAATSFDGQYGPKYLATFTGHQTGRAWAPKTNVAGAVSADGRSWGIKSGVMRWEAEVTFRPIPRDPTFRASLGVYQTALYSDDAQLGSAGAHNAEWSIDDVIEAAFARTCGLALGNLQELIAGTAQTYDLVSVDPQVRAELDAQRWRAGWDAWHTLRLPVIRHAATADTSPRGTRA